MTGPHAFSVLEMAPTLDPAAVKRAYFAALAKHPPHADADGFRRLRSAYESLTRPGALAAAYAACPIDCERELDRWNERFAARLATAAAERQTAEASSEVVAGFIQAASRLTLAALRGKGEAAQHSGCPGPQLSGPALTSIRALDSMSAPPNGMAREDRKDGGEE